MQLWESHKRFQSKRKKQKKQLHLLPLTTIVSLGDILPVRLLEGFLCTNVVLSVSIEILQTTTNLFTLLPWLALDLKLRIEVYLFN